MGRPVCFLSSSLAMGGADLSTIYFLFCRSTKKAPRGQLPKADAGRIQERNRFNSARSGVIIASTSFGEWRGGNLLLDISAINVGGDFPT